MSRLKSLTSCSFWTLYCSKTVASEPLWGVDISRDLAFSSYSFVFWSYWVKSSISDSYLFTVRSNCFKFYFISTVSISSFYIDSFISLLLSFSFIAFLFSSSSCCFILPIYSVRSDSSSIFSYNCFLTFKFSTSSSFIQRSCFSL